MTVLGFDISHWQEHPDLPAAAAQPNIDFGVVKAHDGLTYQYAWYFIEQWPRMRALVESGDLAGAGAYHYWLAEYAGAAQADAYADILNTMGGPIGEFPLIIDIEDDDKNNVAVTKAQIIEGVRGWATRIKQLYPDKRVMAYGRTLLASRGVKASDLPEIDEWWIPRYNDELIDSKLNAPASIGLPDDGWDLWQYTSGNLFFPRPPGLPAVVAGIGPCDISIFNGDLEAFKAWLKKEDYVADQFTPQEAAWLKGLINGMAQGFGDDTLDPPYTGPYAQAGLLLANAEQDGGLSPAPHDHGVPASRTEVT